MAGVRIKELTKRYGDTAAVHGLDLEVAPRELVALLGPSGRGKTTTLRLVAGFLKPELGEIWVGERCLSSPSRVVAPEQRRMAMIFQSYALWPHMTVAGNVGYGLRLRGDVSRSERERRVGEMLRVVKLEGFEARYPGELSGGQQQRVALARALVVEPEILLLDEPLSNLDANLREEMRFEIRRLHETYGITTLYVTHDQAEAMVISDRIAVMQKGQLVQIGTAEDLFERPRTRFVANFIGKTNVIEGRAEDGNRLVRDGIRLHVDGAAFNPGSLAAISIRPHQITVHARGATGVDASANRLVGTIERISYLGDGLDYQVRVEGSDLVLRVTAPPWPRRASGDGVVLAIPPGACVPLQEAG